MESQADQIVLKTYLTRFSVINYYKKKYQQVYIVLKYNKIQLFMVEFVYQKVN